MAEATIIPELDYPDVTSAVAWLQNVFGFAPRLRMGNHRAQLSFGTGSLVVVELRTPHAPCHTLMRVENLDEHYARVVRAGAKILHAPADYPYGERQYTAEDLSGHQWTFSQTIADVDPAAWGGTRT